MLLHVMFTEMFLPDEKGVPLLMHNNISGCHEHSTLLRLNQAVLSHSNSVFLAAAVRQRDQQEMVMY